MLFSVVFLFRHFAQKTASHEAVSIDFSSDAENSGLFSAEQICRQEDKFGFNLPEQSMPGAYCRVMKSLSVTSFSFFGAAGAETVRPPLLAVFTEVCADWMVSRELRRLSSAWRMISST